MPPGARRSIVVRPNSAEESDPIAPRLRTGLHAVLVDDTPILLDVENGRYFLLRRESAKRFRAFWAGCASDEDIQALIVQNIVVQLSHSCEYKSAVEDPRASYVDLSLPHAPRLLLAEAIAFQAWFSFTIRRCRFAHVLASLAAASERHSERPFLASRRSQEVIAAAFVRAQRFTATKDKCFPRSLALAAMLRRHGHHPVVVLGVQLPFAAHCWVQCGDRVVSDTLERTRSFIPILAI